jgi:hypothetical protein
LSIELKRIYLRRKKEISNEIFKHKIQSKSRLLTTEQLSINQQKKKETRIEKGARKIKLL